MILLLIVGVVAFSASVGNSVTCAGERVSRLFGGAPDSKACGGGDVGGPSAANTHDTTQVTAPALAMAPEVCSGGTCRGGNCFVGGTLVDTETGLRPIESVGANERVWSRDLETGASVLSPVVRSIVTPSRPTRALVIEQENGKRDVIGVTPEHRFLLEDGRWAEAGDLAVGDRVRSVDQGTARVVSNLARADAETVWNLEVERTHNYAVGTAHAVVHNDCAVPAPFSMTDLVGLPIGDRLGIVDWWVRLSNDQKRVVVAEIGALRLKAAANPTAVRSRLTSAAHDDIAARWKTVTEWRPQRPPDKDKEDVYRFNGDLGLTVARFPGDSLGWQMRAEAVKSKVERRKQLESQFGPTAKYMPFFSADFDYDPDIPFDIFTAPRRTGVVKKFDPGGMGNPKNAFLGKEAMNLDSMWLTDHTANAIHSRTRGLARDQQAAPDSWLRVPGNIVKDVAARTPLTFLFEKETLAHTPTTDERFREGLVADSVRSAASMEVFSSGGTVFVRPGNDATLHGAITELTPNLTTINPSGTFTSADLTAAAQRPTLPLSLRRAAATLADPEYFAEADGVLGAPDGKVTPQELGALGQRHAPQIPKSVWSSLSPELITIGLPTDGTQPAKLTTIDRWSMAGKELAEKEWELSTGAISIDQYEAFLRGGLPQRVAQGAEDARYMLQLETDSVRSDILQMALDPKFGQRIATEGPRVIADGSRDRARAEFEAREWYERLGVGSWAAVKEVYYLGTGLVDLVVYASDHGNVFLLVKGGRNDGRKLLYQLTAEDVGQIPEGIANAFEEWMKNAQAEPDRATGQAVGFVATFFIPVGEVVTVVRSATVATTSLARARMLMRAGRVLEAEAQMAKVEGAMGKIRGVLGHAPPVGNPEAALEHQKLEKLTQQLESEAAKVEKELAETAGKVEPRKLGDPIGDGPLKQATDNLDVLYEQATVAQKDLGNATREIAAETHGRPVVPDAVKGRPRAMEKVATDYGGDASRLLDLARSTIEYKSLDDLYAGLERLKAKFEISRIKDRFRVPTPEGYRDIMLNVKMPNGHIVEMQLHLEQILAVKNGIGHTLYEEIRTIRAVAAAEGRALTAAELARIEDIVAKSRAAYEAAMKKAGGAIPGS